MLIAYPPLVPMAARSAIAAGGASCRPNALVNSSTEDDGDNIVAQQRSARPYVLAGTNPPLLGEIEFHERADAARH
jgi:hypothetical protein